MASLYPAVNDNDVSLLKKLVTNTALLADAEAGDVTSVNGRTGAVTLVSSDLTMATARLIGRTTAGSGASQEISVGSGLTLSAGSLTNAGVKSVTGTAGQVTTSGATGDITLSLPSTLTGIAGITPTGNFTLNVGANSAITQLSTVKNVFYEGIGGFVCQFMGATGGTPGNTNMQFASNGSDLYLNAPSGLLYFSVAGVAKANFDTAGGLTLATLTTAAPTGSSAAAWKMGDYSAGAPTVDGKIRIQIGSAKYDIPADLIP